MFSFVYDVDVTDLFLLSMISYPNYKFYFPIMALAMYANRYSNAALI